MKFPGAQVIAIDDQISDLNGIVKALQRNGIGVLPFHYRGSRSIKRCLPGVRVVFSDIGLAPSAGPNAQQHRAVAAVLDKVIVEENGPWLLVAWTAAPDQVDDLHGVLLQSLGVRAPIKSIPFSKNEFLDAQGNFRIKDIADAIKAHVTADPIVGAIFDLEVRAASAARDISRSIVDLASHSQQGSGGPAIANILKALSKAIDGGEPKPEYVFQAIAPAFGDRLIRKSISSDERNIWSQAFQAANNTDLNSVQIAELNTSLHLDPGGVAGDRGAISLVPTNMYPALERLVGADLQSIAFRHFLDSNKTKNSQLTYWRNSNPNNRTAQSPPDSVLFTQFMNGCGWYLIEVVPSCDASNQKRGVRRALVCIGVPEKFGRQKAAGNHAVQLPTMKLNDKLVDLYATAKVTLSPPSGKLGNIKPLGRIRDQLLDGVMQHIGNSQSRLGWVLF